MASKEVAPVSWDIRLHRLTSNTGILLAIEPLFLLVVAGAAVGIAIQAVIVAGLVCSMVNAIWPHRPESWLHQRMHRGLVWFGGRSGAHAHALG
jgi:hypothetical protein